MNRSLGEKISTRFTFDLFGNPDTIACFDGPRFVSIDHKETVIVTIAEIRAGMETSATLPVFLDQLADHLDSDFSCFTPFHSQAEREKDSACEEPSLQGHSEVPFEYSPNDIQTSQSIVSRFVGYFGEHRFVANAHSVFIGAYFRSPTPSRFG